MIKFLDDIENGKREAAKTSHMLAKSLGVSCIRLLTEGRGKG